MSLCERCSHPSTTHTPFRCKFAGCECWGYPGADRRLVDGERLSKNAPINAEQEQGDNKLTPEEYVTEYRLWCEKKVEQGLDLTPISFFTEYLAVENSERLKRIKLVFDAGNIGPAIKEQTLAEINRLLTEPLNVKDIST